MGSTFESAVLEVLVDEGGLPDPEEDAHPHYLRVRVLGRTEAGRWLTAEDAAMGLGRVHAEPDVDENDQAVVPDALFDHLLDAFPGVPAIGYDGEYLDPDEEVPAILDEEFSWTCRQLCGVDPV